MTGAGSAGPSRAPTASEQFAGFPSGARATAVPSVFFSELLPKIEDEAELRVTLYVIYALGRRKGYPRFVTERELRSEAPLMGALGDGGDPSAQERLERGLQAAVARGSLLRLDLELEGQRDALYFLNTPADRRALALVREGRLGPGRPLPAERGAPASHRENVFQLYEENIGPLTPLIAEELREAERLYPYEWLEEALREAALLNKRSWRYASRILQRWATEGRKRETAGRDPGAGDSARAQILRRYRGLGGS
jgi:DnaD/phage-associated family protein